MWTYLRHFSTSWKRSLQKRPKYKIEQPYNVFGGFGGPWGSHWRLLEAISGDLGRKLGYVGRCWRQVARKLAYLGRFGRQVGTFLAKCSEKDTEDEPRQANLGGTSSYRGAPGAAIRGARVQPSGTRASPRTRFLDLKVLKIGNTGRSGHQVLHARGQRPAD